MRCAVYSVLLLIVGCSPMQSEEDAYEALVRKCTPILEEILVIQDIRGAAQRDFGITIEYYKKGKVSQEVWKEEWKRWHADENSLATSANYLYEDARKHGCI